MAALLKSLKNIYVLIFRIHIPESIFKKINDAPPFKLVAFNVALFDVALFNLALFDTVLYYLMLSCFKVVLLEAPLFLCFTI